MLSGALASIRILRSAEGRQLRAQHQENVGYLRSQLLQAGVMNFMFLGSEIL